MILFGDWLVLTIFLLLFFSLKNFRSQKSQKDKKPLSKKIPPFLPIWKVSLLNIKKIKPTKFSVLINPIPSKPLSSAPVKLGKPAIVSKSFKKIAKNIKSKAINFLPITSTPKPAIEKLPSDKPNMLSTKSFKPKQLN